MVEQTYHYEFVFIVFWAFCEVFVCMRCVPGGVEIPLTSLPYMQLVYAVFVTHVLRSVFLPN